MLSREECENVLSENKIYLKNQMLKKERISHSVYLLNTVTSLLERLIHEHFDNPRIDWLKNCMREEAFNLIFSSQEEVNKWFDRMRWHVKKCDEYGRELDILKNNPPLKFEELIKHEVVWDNKVKEYAFVLEQYKPTLLNVCAPNDLLAISLKYRWAEEIECLLSQEVGESINDYFVPNRFYGKKVKE